jgi:hypothetical protein
MESESTKQVKRTKKKEEGKFAYRFHLNPNKSRLSSGQKKEKKEREVKSKSVKKRKKLERVKPLNEDENFLFSRLSSN